MKHGGNANGNAVDKSIFVNGGSCSGWGTVNLCYSCGGKLGDGGSSGGRGLAEVGFDKEGLALRCVEEIRIGVHDFPFQGVVERIDESAPCDVVNDPRLRLQIRSGREKANVWARDTRLSLG